MSSRHTAYIGLGSNLGRRAHNLLLALEHLADPATEICRISSVYETAPQGPVADQPDFLNAVAKVRTSLPPPALLARCLSVEQRMGRLRWQLQGPRNIDVDLLLVDSVVGRWPGLELPHAALTRRAFVLRPMLELSPALRDPRSGERLERCLPAVDDQRLFRLGPLVPLAGAEGRQGAAACAG